MAHSHGAPAHAARQLAHFFGQIADTTEWNHACWQALFARLLGAGRTPAELTLGEIQTAIDQVMTRWADCQGTGPRALS